MIKSLAVLAKQHRATLTRVGVIGSVICVLPAIGYLMVRMNPFIVLVALVVPIGVFATLKSLELGLAAMLLAGIFARFRLPTDSDLGNRMRVVNERFAMSIARSMLNHTA